MDFSKTKIKQVSVVACLIFVIEKFIFVLFEKYEMLFNFLIKKGLKKKKNVIQYGKICIFKEKKDE